MKRFGCCLRSDSSVFAAECSGYAPGGTNVFGACSLVCETTPRGSALKRFIASTQVFAILERGGANVSRSFNVRVGGLGEQPARIKALSE